MVAYALRGREEEHATGLEGVVKSRYQARLQCRLQVDHQVAATQQVQPGEGRVLDHVLHRKHHHLADILFHPEPGVILAEEAPQPLGREVLRNVGRIDPGARAGNRVVVQIRGVELDLELALRLVHVFAQQHGDGIGPLAAGATGHPGAKHIVFGLVLEQHRQHVNLECDEGLRVAKEPRHVDQQLLEQHHEFGGVLLQVAHIDLGVVNVVLRHAPLDAPANGALLVLREIVPRGRAQQRQDAVHAAAGSGGQRQFLQHSQLAHAGQQGLRHLVRRQDLRDVAGLDRARGHAVELGLGRLLHQRDAAGSVDGARPERAVGAGAREDDAHGILALVFGERAQEGVDRHALPARLLGNAQLQPAVEDSHVAIRRDDVDMVRLHQHLVHRFQYRHGGAALQDLRQDAGVAGVQMRHQHEGHAAVGGRVLEELLERLQPAGRGAQADDGKGLCWRRARRMRRFLSRAVGGGVRGRLRAFLVRHGVYSHGVLRQRCYSSQEVRCSRFVIRAPEYVSILRAKRILFGSDPSCMDSDPAVAPIKS